MKIALIAPDHLPIPAIRGGAIETLCTHFIQQNEAADCPHEIKVYQWGIWDGVTDCQPNYLHTELVPIRRPLLNGLLWRIPRTYLLSPLFPDCFPYCDWFLLKLAKELRKTKPDLILLEGCQWYAPYLRRHIKNVPIYLHVHTDILNKETRDAKKIVDACDGIICVSDYIKNQISFVPSIKKAPLYVVHNCVDTTLFRFSPPEREKIRASLGFNKNDKVLIFCGRLNADKGIAELIQAMSALPEDYKLIVVGAAWFSSKKPNAFENKLRQAARPLSNRIVFTGYIDNQYLPSYYSAADLGVVPSLWQEAAGLVLLEQAACRLPVISTDRGGIPSYVSDSFCTLLHPKSDCFVEQLSQAIRAAFESSEWQQRSECAEAFAAQFSPRRYYHDMLSFLHI